MNKIEKEWLFLALEMEMAAQREKHCHNLATYISGRADMAREFLQAAGYYRQFLKWRCKRYGEC